VRAGPEPDAVTRRRRIARDYRAPKSVVYVPPA
jgi:hypothetical protein